MFHKNIKTVAGCLSRVTCDITAPEGVDTTLTAFLVYEGESRPATLESADVIIFPAVPYGHYAYEIRCGGKPVAFGHLLARASAFPHTEGVVDYTLEADLSTTEAAQIELTLTPGPRGPQGEKGERGAPLRYEDLTPEQRAELAAPLSERVSALEANAKTALVLELPANAAVHEGVAAFELDADKEVSELRLYGAKGNAGAGEVMLFATGCRMWSANAVEAGEGEMVFRFEPPLPVTGRQIVCIQPPGTSGGFITQLTPLCLSATDAGGEITLIKHLADGGMDEAQGKLALAVAAEVAVYATPEQVEQQAAHAVDAGVHVTPADKERWNALVSFPVDATVQQDSAHAVAGGAVYDELYGLAIMLDCSESTEGNGAPYSDWDTGADLAGCVRVEVVYSGRMGTAPVATWLIAGDSNGRAMQISVNSVTPSSSGVMVFEFAQPLAACMSHRFWLVASNNLIDASAVGNMWSNKTVPYMQRHKLAGGQIVPTSRYWHVAPHYVPQGVFDSLSERVNVLEATGGGGGDVLLSGANTFTGSNVFADNFSVLPLGQTTALGAPAFGLHVSSSGGLQLFGTHFLLSDMWSDHSLKVVNDTVCLSSSEQAALGFDYANKVVFRTMPNDGSTANDSAGAVYEFQGWQWQDDSHTERMACPVDVRKAAAGALSDDSLLNRAEGDERWVRGHLIAASPNNYTNAAASVSASYGSSLAVGGYSSCSRNDATAIGFHARTLNTGGVALGCESYSSAIDACALGTYSKAQGQNAVALGREATATGQNTIAVGYKVSVSKNSGVSIGNGSKVSGLYGTAIGYNCQSTATETGAAYYGGFTAGQSCTASAPGGIALGHGATAATNKHTTALGQWCKAYGANSLVLGGYGETHGTESVAIGFKAVAKANQSVAIGCTAEVNDAGCAVVATWNTAVNMRTQLYIIGAGSALAEKYYPTPSGSVATNGCLAFVTKKTDGTVVATGMKKLTDLLSDNVYNAETGEGFVATLGLEDEPAPMPFLPEDGFAPIDTSEPIIPQPEPEQS